MSFQQNQDMDELQKQVNQLANLMETSPDNLSSLELLAMYPFLFLSRYKSTPFLFENTYCEIETYIACTCKVYLECYSKIINSTKFKRDMFTRSYKNLCVKIISNMFNYEFDEIMELVNKRYRIYLTRDCKIYNHLKEIILCSQSTECFLDYNQNTPLVIADGIQDSRLQIQIMSILEGLNTACERQCIEVASRYSGFSRNSYF